MGARAYGSRHNVDRYTKSEFHPGITTMEEVLLLLGEPDAAEGDQRFSYSWVRRYAWSPDIGGPGRKWRLEIEFDVNKRVSRVNVSNEYSWLDQ